MSEGNAGLPLLAELPGSCIRTRDELMLECSVRLGWACFLARVAGR